MVSPTPMPSSGNRRPSNHTSPSAGMALSRTGGRRSEEHTSELQSRGHLVCRLLLNSVHANPVCGFFPTRRSSDLGRVDHIETTLSWLTHQYPGYEKAKFAHLDGLSHADAQQRQQTPVQPHFSLSRYGALANGRPVREGFLAGFHITAQRVIVSDGSNRGKMHLIFGKQHR